MKTIVSNLISLVVILCVLPCALGITTFAESETNTQLPDSTQSELIDFRGIPFGTKFNDVIEMLKNQGVNIVKEEISVTNEGELYGNGSNTFSVRLPDTITICGDIEVYLSMGFICLRDTEVTLENSCLYYAEYGVTGVSARKNASVSEKNDISEKHMYCYNKLSVLLTDKYNGLEHRYIGDNTATKMGGVSTWEDVNGSKVKLDDAAYSDGSGHIQVKYEWREGTELVEEYIAEEEVRQHEEYINSILSAGNDGL